MGTSATVRLIEDVRLIRCPLNTGFTVLAVLKNTKIDLVTVFDAILTSRQTCEKLLCLFENLMSNNFRTTVVLKKNINLFHLCFSPLFPLEKRGSIGNLAKFPKLRDFSAKMEIPYLLACVASVSVLFLARPKPRISFLGLSLLRNSTETLATQAIYLPLNTYAV